MKMKNEYQTRAVGRFMVAEKEPGNPWWIRMRRGGSILGTVAWYGPWKTYIFRPEEMTEFSGDCLTAIAAFLGSLGRGTGCGKEATDAES